MGLFFGVQKIENDLLIEKIQHHRDSIERKLDWMITGYELPTVSELFTRYNAAKYMGLDACPICFASSTFDCCLMNGCWISITPKLRDTKKAVLKAIKDRKNMITSLVFGV